MFLKGDVVGDRKLVDSDFSFLVIIFKCYLNFIIANLCYSFHRSRFEITKYFVAFFGFSGFIIPMRKGFFKFPFFFQIFCSFCALGFIILVTFEIVLDFLLVVGCVFYLANH